MLILLPPSEGKVAPRRGRPLDLDGLGPDALRTPREEALDALMTLCRTDPGAPAVLGVGPSQGEEVARNARLREAPTAPAERVYAGVLYEALDLPTLTGSVRRRANRAVRVTSALFGLLRPQDRVPAYRLSAGVRLPGLAGGRTMAAFWSRHLAEPLEEEAGAGLVVDLRSSAYVPFWRPPARLAGRVATVRVLHEVGGRLAVVSHGNKATKGRLVRSLLTDAGLPRSPSALADQLRDLGWTVHQAADGRPGTLDVVVGAP